VARQDCTMHLPCVKPVCRSDQCSSNAACSLLLVVTQNNFLVMVYCAAWLGTAANPNPHADICPMHMPMHDVLLRASSTHVLTSHWTLPIRYSLLWNLPSTGHVTLPAGGGHTWHGDAVPHLSFWVTTTAAPAPALALAPVPCEAPAPAPADADADAPADAQGTSTAPKPPPKESHWAERMRKYTAVTGRAPLIGGFMSGYWQSRNR